MHTHARDVSNAVPWQHFLFVFFQVGCNTLDLGFHLREARTLKLSSDKNINKISHAHFPAPGPGLHSPDPALIFLVSQYPGDEGEWWGGCFALPCISEPESHGPR